MIAQTILITKKVEFDGAAGNNGNVTANWAYHQHDALGSLRQLTDADGTVTLTKSYLPYGEELSSSGTGVSSYGFTGEMTDSTGMVYLRARYYAPDQGRFISRDVWTGDVKLPISSNRWLYTYANPINMRDPSGFVPSSSGPWNFINCFDISVTKGWDSPWISAKEAVDICRGAYSRNDWSGWESMFGFHKPYPTTARELFGWYVFEHGNDDHLWFDASQPLTKELIESWLTKEIRASYRTRGETEDPAFIKFNKTWMISTLVLDFEFNISLSQFLGSIWYQVKTLPDGRIGIRVDNDTTLASGSHFAERHEDEGYVNTVEGLIESGSISGEEPLYKISDPQYRVISILKEQKRGESEGGGNLYQTYYWTEKYDPCRHWIFPAIDVQIWSWSDFKNKTEPMLWE